MKKETTNRYIFSALGALLGILLIVFPSILPFSRVLWILLIILGVFIILNNITPLVFGIKASETEVGKMAIITSIINMILGVCLIFFQNIVMIIIISLLLIAVPIIEVVKSADQVAKLKEEFFKILTGVLLIIFGPVLLSCADTIGKILCYIAGGAVIILSIVNLVDTIIKSLPKKEHGKEEKSAERIDAEFTEKK